MLLTGLLLTALTAPGLAQSGGGDSDARQVPGGSGIRTQNGNQQVGEKLQQATSHWEDVIHYLRIAQLDLAKSSAEALLEMELEPAELLRVVDELGPYRDYAQTLQRGQGMDDEEIAELAKRVSDRIQQSRLAMAKEGERIRRSIRALDDGLRARLNAEQRLEAAGQYAAPHLLEVLATPGAEHDQLRPYVIEAMVSVGRPIVGPLSESLAGLEPVAKQQVAEVLGRIGYPLALPYLKAELADDELSAQTRRVIRRAFDQIVELSDVPGQADAARLFLMLGEDYYQQRRDLVLEPGLSHNLMWNYTAEAGLSALEVPTPIYHDAMAMRSAERALELNENLSAALSLWTAANFRRENNLPAGEEDPSYAGRRRSPHYYATLAGPNHLHPVLQRALNENNAELALDAIAALAYTSGTENLINLEGDIQPLLAAMDYPDRRVRFEAAFTIARSVPRTEFSGAQRVVPVLSEALRQGAGRYAVVIGPDTGTLNQASSLISGAGDYSTLLGNSIEAATPQIEEAPAVNLIVINGSVEEAAAAVSKARQRPRLAAVPILVFASGDEMQAANRRLGDQAGVFVANRDAERETRLNAVEEAAGWSRGAQISDEQALEYATTALDILHELTVAQSEVFRPLDAQAALLEALNDDRQEVALGSAEVLARFPTVEAQQALATAALSGERGEQMQVQLLRILSRSARINGNQLKGSQLDALSQMVDTTEGTLADAAAEAHGALNLPTAKSVERILQ